jgi:gliding motility-associated-like protein
MDPGTYWLEIDVNGCKFRDSIEVAEVPLPTADLGQDTSVCDNEEYIISVDNPSGFDISWQDGSMGNSIIVDAPGQYIVTIDDNGCANKDSIEIAFKEAPDVDLGIDVAICEGEVFDLAVPDPLLQFVWEDGSSDNIRGITTSGIYSLEVEENDCTSRDSIEVLVNLNPTVDLGRDTIVCDDVPFTLRPISDVSQFIWGDSSTASTFLVATPGEIKVTVIDGACMGSDSINVGFKECINFAAYIPNAFSPNEDGYNDVFEVFFSKGLIVESFNMSIYDRWGNEVFKSDTYGEFWDGRYQANFLDRGVYTYFINVSYIDDFGPDETSISGDITILE